jgi:hypothetical protein
VPEELLVYCRVLVGRCYLDVAEVWPTTPAWGLLRDGDFVFHFSATSADFVSDVPSFLYLNEAQT